MYLNISYRTSLTYLFLNNNDYNNANNNNNNNNVNTTTTTTTNNNNNKYYYFNKTYNKDNNNNNNNNICIDILTVVGCGERNTMYTEVLFLTGFANSFREEAVSETGQE